ncbi:neuron navigator 2-like [Limulus polyphemus]|uniref:Neuron navigator 2-like n=1 Tax=Limulus polyphemus TaxID=6850 RepID=A0ABM1SG69_LIMPO|nr:neuron navigator 2-like [Limulus polyphemus]
MLLAVQAVYRDQVKSVTTSQSRAKQQREIYTDWANHYLERGRFKRYIQDLQTDVSDGSLLADVIEAVTGTYIPNIARKPKTAAQMVDNINACLNFLDELGVNVVDITAQDIRDGSLKAILGLFFNLSRYKQAQKTAATANNQPSSGYSQGRVGLTPSSGGEMLSKLPTLSKPSTGRVPTQSCARENSSSIPAPPSTVNNNRKNVNQTEKSRNLTNPGNGMTSGTTGRKAYWNNLFLVVNYL